MSLCVLSHRCLDLVTINVQLYQLVTVVQCPKCHVIVVSFANFLLQGYFGLSVATAEPNYYMSHCKIHFREVGIVDVCLVADTETSSSW